MFNYDDPVVFTQNEQRMIDLLAKCFKSVNLSFSEIKVQRRTESYLTFLDKNGSDFLRIKAGVSSTWFSIDGCRLNDSLKEDPRFDIVAKKNIRHWKIPLKSIDDITNYVDIIIKFLEPNIIFDDIDFRDNVELIKTEPPKEYIVLDFETTGLSNSDKIIQIGAILVNNNFIIDSMYTLVNPKMSIPNNASKMNHIYDKDVENAPYIEDIIQDLLKFLDNKIIIGHNITFDLRMLSSELTSLKIDLPSFYYYDTLDISKKMIDTIEKHTLEHLCNYYNIINEKPHDALSDCKAENELFMHLIKNCTLSSPSLYTYHETDKNTTTHREKTSNNRSKKQYDISDLHTDKADSITISNHTFVVTGKFDYGNSKNAIKDYIISNGGIIKTSIPKKRKTVDYLIIGNNGWDLDKPSEKYTNANEYNREHTDSIIILKEADFFDIINKQAVKQ